MTVYFVSRHAGAKFWAKYHDERLQLPLSIDRYVEHYESEWTQPGDVVIGTLPLKEIAAVQLRGGQFVSLDLHMPPGLRGTELTATEMTKLGAVLTPYRVDALETRVVPAAKLVQTPSATRSEQVRSITIMLVSDQLAPQLIGLDVRPSTHALLITTKSMKRKAATLQQLLDRKLKAASGSDSELDPTVQLKEIEAESFQQFRHHAQRVVNDCLQNGFAPIVLNATGGTKPMSMAFVEAAQEARRQGVPVQIIYIDTGLGVADMLTPEDPVALPSVLNIEELIACSGRKAVACAQASPFFQQQMARDQLHEHLLRIPEAALGALNLVMSKVESGERVGGADGVVHVTEEPLIRALATSHLQGHPKLGAHLQQAGVLSCEPDFSPQSATIRLTSKSEIAYLNGGWLEAYVAKRLSEGDVDDWAANLKVEGAKNELDGVAAAGNRLLMVEVKTQKQRRGHSNDDRGTYKAAEQSVYKLDSLGTSLAPLFGKRWYVSARPLDRTDLERAHSLGICVFAPKAGDKGRPISAFASELRLWVGERPRSMVRSPNLRRSTVPVDSENWSPQRTGPFAKSDASIAGGSLKPSAISDLQALKSGMTSAQRYGGPAAPAKTAKPRSR